MRLQEPDCDQWNFQERLVIKERCKSLEHECSDNVSNWKILKILEIGNFEYAGLIDLCNTTQILCPTNQNQQQMSFLENKPF